MKNKITLLLLSVFGWMGLADTQVAGEYIVHAPEGMALTEFQQQLEQQNPTVRLIDREKGWFLIQRPAIENDTFGIMTASTQLPAGTVMEPNVIFSIDEISNDEFAELQFNLFGKFAEGQTDCRGIPLDNVKSVGMENVTQLPLQSVLVAVVDTGVDLYHPDLRSNIFVNIAELQGQPGVDDDGNGYADDVQGFDFFSDQPNGNDDNGHGTHVAGVIAASTNNDIGMASIASTAKILPVKFLGANGSGTLEGALKALAYAETMGAKVINASFGGGSDSEALREKVADLESKGIIVAAAAGNSGMDLDVVPAYPASYPHSNVVTVGATKANGQLARFSNRSASVVEIAAPGENILSTYKDGSYECLSGTSMATPHVAAALSLAISMDPQADHLEIIEKVLSTADSEDDLKAHIGEGRFLRVDKLLESQ